MENIYKKLKSGSDIRGTAADGVVGEEIELTDKAVFDLTVGFCKWLKENNYEGNTVAVGHDSRISALRIKRQVIAALGEFGYKIYDCSYASTPAMFMTTVYLDCIASVQITASHHPFNKNGLKFFTKDGGLNGEDIERITVLACENYESNGSEPDVEVIDYMSIYSKGLRKMICDELGVTEADKPLNSYKIVVDAGNGVGGFYANDVLAPLGADVSASQFLDMDGMFPNHAPNPENKDAMKSICQATVNADADLGVIFDTDVDRAGAVLADGSELPGDSWGSSLRVLTKK